MRDRLVWTDRVSIPLGHKAVVRRTRPPGMHCNIDSEAQEKEKINTNPRSIWQSSRRNEVLWALSIANWPTSDFTPLSILRISIQVVIGKQFS